VVVGLLRRHSGQQLRMPGDRDSRSTAAQETLDVLRAAGSAIGALGRRRVKEQAVQQALQLEVWEDEGAPAAPAED
jgi:hypothetical protein